MNHLIIFSSLSHGILNLSIETSINRVDSFFFSFFCANPSSWNTFFRFCPRYSSGLELATHEHQSLSYPYSIRTVIAAANCTMIAPAVQDKSIKPSSYWRKTHNSRQHTALRRTSLCYNNEDSANDIKNSKQSDNVVNHHGKLHDEADVFERATQIVM